MAIKVRQAGLTKLYGELGTKAGKAQKAREDEQRAARMQEIILHQEHEKEMAQFDAELRIAAEKRARMWELEKAEMRSKLDFEREERRRQQQLEENDAKMKALDRALETGIIDRNDYNLAILQQSTGVPFYTQSQITGRADRPLTPEQQIQQYFLDIIKGTTTTPNAPVQGPETKSTERVRMVAPDGTTGTVEAWEVPLYKSKGYTSAPAQPKPEPVETKKLDERGYPVGYKQFRGFYF